ncbi:PREDICTED: venom protease-like [Papilio polytes]|uniref:venom protease-like n=1 Tax=Papilio polytes TaxID=76194 RepID=UPI000675D6D7|nr:PREDICTED: venom protease-like [Papilio polytes]
MYTILIYLLLFDGAFMEAIEGDSCVVEHINIVGKCSPPDKCNAAKNDYLLNGIKPTFCQYSFSNVLVCCRDGSSILQAATQTLRQDKDNTDNRRISERKCEEYSRIVTQNVVYTPLVPGEKPNSVSTSYCLHSHIELVVGGENANLGEFPHMAAIGWVNFDDQYKFSCGGSLISTKHVLTAGHCSRNPLAKDPIPAIVRLGDLNLDPSVQDGANPIDVPIKTIHIHPEYKSPMKYHDIAILELAADVDIDSSIRPACLWSGADFGPYTVAFATGWGTTDPHKNQPSNDLQKVSLTLLDNNNCDGLLRNTRNRLWQGFSETQICAGEIRGGKDTCQGDSGSPLQVEDVNNACIFYVMGVTSFGGRCGQREQPAVYTRVSSYIQWIESVVWPQL